MATGKSVNLRVRPVVSADLSYPVDGIISRQEFGLLGSQVQALDVEALYLLLGETAPGDDSRLIWDSERIWNYLSNAASAVADPVGPTLLSQLRNAAEAADLDRAVLMRQNAYLTSYSPSVLHEARQIYYDDPRDETAVRHRLLKAVETDAGRIHQGLTDAYIKRGWATQIVEYAKTTTDNKASQYSGAGTIQFEGLTDTQSRGYEFRYPAAENDLRYHNARAAVRQEFLAAWRMSEMFRYENTTFPNELGAIDHAIRRLQCAYIDTFLFSPSNGTVTGVFHNRGDFVRAGEPVLRIEQDGLVYLVGTVKYRGALRIGTMLAVTTTLFEAEAAAPVTVTAEVVAVRGHDSVSEQWDILALCENVTADGGRILPLNYNFDFESTTVEVTAA